MDRATHLVLSERDVLQTHAERWLVRQVKGQKVQSALSVLLWPFSVVRQFLFDARYSTDKNVDAISRLITRYIAKHEHTLRHTDMQQSPNIETGSLLH